jgi:hypothetical protein
MLIESVGYLKIYQIKYVILHFQKIIKYCQVNAFYEPLFILNSVPNPSPCRRIGRF